MVNRYARRRVQTIALFVACIVQTRNPLVAGARQLPGDLEASFLALNRCNRDALENLATEQALDAVRHLAYSSCRALVWQGGIQCGVESLRFEAQRLGLEWPKRPLTEYDRSTIEDEYASIYSGEWREATLTTEIRPYTSVAWKTCVDQWIAAETLMMDMAKIGSADLWACLGLQPNSTRIMELGAEVADERKRRAASVDHNIRRSQLLSVARSQIIMSLAKHSHYRGGFDVLPPPVAWTFSSAAGAFDPVVVKTDSVLDSINRPWRNENVVPSCSWSSFLHATESLRWLKDKAPIPEAQLELSRRWCEAGLQEALTPEKQRGGPISSPEVARSLGELVSRALFTYLSRYPGNPPSTMRSVLGVDRVALRRLWFDRLICGRVILSRPSIVAGLWPDWGAARKSALEVLDIIERDRPDELRLVAQSEQVRPDVPLGEGTLKAFHAEGYVVPNGYDLFVLPSLMTVLHESHETAITTPVHTSISVFSQAKKGVIVGPVLSPDGYVIVEVAAVFDRTETLVGEKDGSSQAFDDMIAIDNAMAMLWTELHANCSTCAVNDVPEKK
jgi:hypothetical protein